MLKKIRIVLATIFFLGLTFLFVDVTDTAQKLLGWMPRLQFLPAVMALNIGVLALLVLLTLACGRIYCSVICPLGVFQDIVARLTRREKTKPYRFTKPKNTLRLVVLTSFILLSALGAQSLALLLAPYSSYGRMVQNLLAPLYRAGNNLLAYCAEQVDSYAFSASDIYIHSAPTFALTLVFALLIVLLVWRGGRIWCNTFCPVGTVLGVLAHFSWFRPVLDSEKCVRCRTCEQGCKAACIDIATQSVDLSRCVACMNCMDKCPRGAIRYAHGQRKRETGEQRQAALNPVAHSAASAVAGKEAVLPHSSLAAPLSAPLAAVSPARRTFLLGLSAALLATAGTAGRAIAAEENRTDGGLAELKPRRNPKRTWPLRPPGARSQKNFTTRCTGCQLCVAACPNEVLRPAASLSGLMQPELFFDRGYCRPECTRCAEVCPTGAIQRIGKAEKSGIHIGAAVWDKSLCLPASGGDKCGNCERHCPNGSITLVDYRSPDGREVQVPAVDTERCIGCGACEYVCPVRPVSAIHVDGFEVHRFN